MNVRILALALALPFAGASGLGAQGVVVDQGQFSIRIRGANVGTETFVIRRAGLAREDAVFASGVVTTRIDGVSREIRPLLRAAPPEGLAESYQAEVTGPRSMDVRVARSGRRYVATIRSTEGDEDREFQARENTRILELDVAHHYYFLRDTRAGEVVNALEPISRHQLTLTAGERSETSLALGPNTVQARRVDFTGDGDDRRSVWFDRQGRVLRVEIPSRAYVAERTDLVG